MTHRTGGAGGGIPRIWLLPIAIVTALLGVTAAGLLSRSLILDLVAWWPVWLVVAILVPLAAGRRMGRVRAAGLVPLVATVALGFFVYGHLAAWALMPSAAPTLVGPPPGPTTSAALSARVDGRLHLGSGSEFLYVVRPIRGGGDIGVPEATEQVQNTSISILLTPPADPGFLAFSGWDIELSAVPNWNLSLQGTVEADLSGLELTGLQLAGEGLLVLGSVGAPTPVSVSGSFELMIPPGSPARVVGDAVVPDTWEEVADGWRSPAGGDGWVISPTTTSSVTIGEG